MSMEVYEPGVGIAAGAWMMKYLELGPIVRAHPLRFQPGDKVNVFINFECVLKNIASMKNLQSIATFHKHKFVIELESAILNLIAHYRAFFKRDFPDTKLFFYFTALNDSPQQMETYNKFYRSYYLNRYTQNPQFRQIGSILADIVIPEIKLILSYVPNCYFIEADGFDGSIIPLVIHQIRPAKNLIISGDVFDSLYLFNPNFCTVYMKRRFQHFTVVHDIDTAIQSIVKGESPFDLNIFASEMYYRLLLSIKGSKIRNIRSAKGFGYGRFMNLLKEGMEHDLVLQGYTSIDSILELFPEKYRADIKVAFQCTSIERQYALLGDPDVEAIRHQIVDKIDIKSVESLNRRRFQEFPINLSNLIY